MGIRFSNNGGGGGSASIRKDNYFSDAASRDDYFATNPSKLFENIHVSTAGELQRYEDGVWVGVSEIYRGPAGVDASPLLLQYSANGSTGWSTTLNQSLHKYWRWSTDGGATWSPNGVRYSAASAASGVPDPYRYEVGGNGKLQLFKNDKMIAEQDDDGTWLADSVATGTGSIHLGDIFSNGVAGDNVVWLNHGENLAYYGAMAAVSSDGSSQKPMIVRTHGAKQQQFPNGQYALATPIDYDYTFTAPANMTFFALGLCAAETYNGRLRWRVVDQDFSIEVVSFYFNVDVQDGTFFDVTFKYPLWAKQGKNYRLTLTKDDGTLLKVRSGEDGVTPFRENQYASYEDHLVFHGGNPEMAAASLNTLAGSDRISFGAIKNVPYAGVETAGVVKVGPTMSVSGDGELNTSVSPTGIKIVADSAARLSISQSTGAIIAIQQDTGETYGIEANDDPAVSGNWKQIGTVATDVVSFNGRSGAVVPQAGDYTLDMVTTTDATASKDYKLVIDNGTLYMEEV